MLCCSAFLGQGLYVLFCNCCEHLRDQAQIVTGNASNNAYSDVHVEPLSSGSGRKQIATPVLVGVAGLQVKVAQHAGGLGTCRQTVLSACYPKPNNHTYTGH